MAVAVQTAQIWRNFLCVFAQDHPDFRLQVESKSIHRYKIQYIITIIPYTLYLIPTEFVQCHTCISTQELLSLASISKCQIKFDPTSYSVEVSLIIILPIHLN